MELLKAHSLNFTKLKNRILWFDGDSTVNAADIINNVIINNVPDSLFVEELTDEIMQYNLLVPKEKQVKVKKDIKKLTFEWNIPEEYKKLDVMLYVLTKLVEKDGLLEDIRDREQRCIEELALYEELGLLDTLRTLIYIINILEKENVVWGVGRGSSVSSYVLYILNLHDVDSYHYNLNIKEFLRK